MINLKQNTNKRLVIHFCALQSIIFLLLTVGFLIYMIYGIKINETHEGWFTFLITLTFCFYVFAVLTLIIAKIPLISSFGSWKTKLLYLFTFGIFLLKVKDENIADFKLYKKTNIAMIFIWISLFIGYLIFHTVGNYLTDNWPFAGLDGVIFFESILILSTLAPLVFNLFLYKKSLSLAK
ncbi:hypothetical protein [Mycoplasmopsis gallinacea]|uniref:Uncharacterized protein n=1 Tax=Mycoplasmopsis gallinacea TaxID=29556 RepID=A0A6H0V7N5_9BACT|nr:hypothetical protein [Mycoplasmopsis gallinacea]QIW62505.1 hypothetical protein GOQ20_03740 [Mycoplasmopsis gallinacea]